MTMAMFPVLSACPAQVPSSALSLVLESLKDLVLVLLEVMVRQYSCPSLEY